MAGKDSMLKQLREEIPEITPQELEAQLGDAQNQVVVLDVREPEEVQQGHVPGAAYIPRSYLELRIEDKAPHKDRPVVAYCAGGTRSLFAAKALKELGYQDIYSLKGGFTAWKNAGLEFEIPRDSRHLLIPEVGEEGQQKLLDANVLMLGAGGLGAPAAIYLAAAGVGKIGIVDDDVVDESNLQRQVIHRTVDVGRPKIDSAREFIKNLNPDVEVVGYRERLTSDNIFRILDEGWDVVLNGCDNFPTRYLLNDACFMRNIPIVDGSIFRFEGQVSVLKPEDGPCYRCMYPEPPPPELAPSCAEAGVLGVLPGIVGSLQGLEVIKMILGVGEPLVGRLLHFDALSMKFRELKLERDPACPLCGEERTIHDLIDYEFFCAAPAEAGG